MPRPSAPIQDVDRTIGANLRNIRLGRDMPQPALARSCGISESMLSKVENGRNRIRVDTLARAAEALNVGVGEFFAAVAEPARDAA